MPRWIDLSHAYHEGMTHQPVAGPPCIETLLQVGRDPYNLQRFTFITHLGTHVDAPLHFIKDGRTIDTYELGELGGPHAPVPLSGGSPVAPRSAGQDGGR